MKTEPNKQKLMDTRYGVIAKPKVRRGKRRGRGSFPWPVEERESSDRTRWYSSIADLFGRRQ